MSRRPEQKAPVLPPNGTNPAQVPGLASSPSSQTKGGPANWLHRWKVPAICIFLAAITWLVFGQALGFNFVNYDDDMYVYNNPVVQQGLTWEGFRWALTYGGIGHWHPLTWLTHMLDCQLYGLNAGGPHFTNVLLHTATVILLFLLLRQMTGCLWRSAFVAAIFAIHPLRAESVAWVAERKDVLSGLFFMLTIGAYVRYVRCPPSMTRYGGIMLCFALGLLSKNMLATLPFVLLLLDYWPLNRLPGFSSGILLRRVIEKAPLFVLTIASCVITFLVPEKLSGYEHLPLGLRLENVAVSYVTYLRQMIYPSGLACLYPNPTTYLPSWQVAGAVGLLLAISGLAWALHRSRPWLLVGWLWYLGMMVPVIGIVQISYYAHADRYTYLPQIGVYLLLTWAAADFSARLRHRQWVLAGLSSVILAALICRAHTQVSYWRNSEALWTHTLACTPDNAVARNDLGSALLQSGNVGEAIVQYQKALQLDPNFAQAHGNLGNALCQKGDMAGGIAQLQRALQISPDNVLALNNLGNALCQKGNVDDAIIQYQKALQINPNDAPAHNNLGSALYQKGNLDDAIVQYQESLQIDPGFAKGHDNLGNALCQKGNLDEAIAQYQEALKNDPGFASARYDLGSALLKAGDAEAAMAQFQDAVQINPHLALAYDGLGNILSEMGRADEAMVQYQKALQINPNLAPAHNNLATILAEMGRLDEAIVHYQKALQINPDYAEAHNNLGNVLLMKGNVQEAIAQYQKVLQLNPDFVQTLNSLAWVLATSPQSSLRNGSEAVELAQRANHLTGDENPVILGTLAAAYAEAGRFPDAVKTARHALQLAESQANTARADAIRSQLKLYQAGSPFRANPTP